MNPKMRASPERFGEVVTQSTVSTCFLYFVDELRAIGFTQDLAAQVFLQDYYSAWLPWTNATVSEVFQRVRQENLKKYEKLIAVYAAQYDPLVNYDRLETESSTRTPNLTTSRANTTSSEDSRATQKNQTEHRADKPVAPSGGTWSSTTTHNVAPYDTSSFSPSEQDVTTEDGYRETETSYTGQPDTESTTRSGNEYGTTTETGTENTIRRLETVGNIGVTSSQDMAEQEIKLAEKMNIFRVIERDIAAKLFLQVW